MAEIRPPREQAYERTSRRKLAALFRHTMDPYRRDDGYVPETAVERTLHMLRRVFYQRGYQAGYRDGQQKAIREGRSFTGNGEAA